MSKKFKSEVTLAKALYKQIFVPEPKYSFKLTLDRSRYRSLFPTGFFVDSCGWYPDNPAFLFGFESDADEQGFLQEKIYKLRLTKRGWNILHKELRSML
jgi:hypothetical protein